MLCVRRRSAIALLTLTLLTSLISGCASSNTSFAAYCALAEPILLNDDDLTSLERGALSLDAKRAILRINETYVKTCLE